MYVVVATTKVHIFKQITTLCNDTCRELLLLLLPQRYIFSSKSQHSQKDATLKDSCCCYHKGTYFQANHNTQVGPALLNVVVVATTKVHIFKQITTNTGDFSVMNRCCCYHKGTYFQANHNKSYFLLPLHLVVVATTKVHIFKQITTYSYKDDFFSGCCCYHKGTYFQANHNTKCTIMANDNVVVATTKVHIFKQITTYVNHVLVSELLLLLPQRYIFSSKSQQNDRRVVVNSRCCCYHKGTYFQANHNVIR